MKLEDFGITGEEAKEARARAEELCKLAQSSNPAELVELLKVAFNFGAMAQRAGDMAGNVGAAVGGAALTGLGFGAANALIDRAGRVIGNAGEAKRKAQAYQGMMEMNPELGEHDAGQVQALFNTMYRFNPEYASDPLLSSNFVQQALESERMPIQTINELVKARATMEGRGVSSGPLNPGMANTAFGKDD